VGKNQAREIGVNFSKGLWGEKDNKGGKSSCICIFLDKREFRPGGKRGKG